jgi:hypothetical protein
MRWWRRKEEEQEQEEEEEEGDEIGKLTESMLSSSSDQ